MSHTPCECGSVRYKRFQSYLYCRSCGRPYASNRKVKGFDSPSDSAAKDGSVRVVEQQQNPEAEARTRQWLAELDVTRRCKHGTFLTHRCRDCEDESDHVAAIARAEGK